MLHAVPKDVKAHRRTCCIGCAILLHSLCWKAGIFRTLWAGKLSPFWRKDSTLPFPCPEDHWFGLKPRTQCISFFVLTVRSRSSSQVTLGPSSSAKRVKFAFTVSRCRLCFPNCHGASPDIAWRWIPWDSNHWIRDKLRRNLSASYRKFLGTGKWRHQFDKKACLNSSAGMEAWGFVPCRMTHGNR